MKTIHLLLGLGALGLFTGYASHRLTGISRAETPGAADSVTQSQARENRIVGSSRASGSRKKPAKKIELPPVQCGDTLETLNALPMVGLGLPRSRSFTRRRDGAEPRPPHGNGWTPCPPQSARKSESS